MIVVLDTSVLVAFFDGEDAHHTDAHGLLADVAGEDLVISSMTLAELLVGPVRQGEDALASTLDALTTLAIREAQLPEDVAVRLAGLRASTGLKMPDCCVVLAAETAEADSVATFDERLARAARQHGFDTMGVSQ
ncbi:type II toxin-antitoxin system VapC family toxin [Mycobacterium avium]|uniref:Ribonuclease VapC n=1 Tax=Mycobacterium avium subsp. hominissuis TaxID=439334 RepID=A0AAI8X2U1_MYCAV|nr:type II toxin-antitoxin system VapC family toxin [Mycobacterium avium]BBN50879.1 hypothetical protein JPH1_53540 [Mycobacterium avium subsp. hominissuis]